MGLMQSPKNLLTESSARAAIGVGVAVAVLVPLAFAIPAFVNGASSSQSPNAVDRTSLKGAAGWVRNITSQRVQPVPAAPGPLPQAGPPLSTLIKAPPQTNAPGPEIMALEQRLTSLSYMVGKVDGALDGATRHGIIAFQKVEGLPRTGQVDPPTLARLDTANVPAPAFNTPSDHIEIDIPRQVVFVVRGGKVSATLPTSTGNNKKFTSEGYTRRAVTPNGTFRIQYKRQGWRKSPLGMLYRPAYFNGGIALHGSRSVPVQPASHGCVRLPMAFADWFADNASPVGMVVYVHGGPTGENPQPVLDLPGIAPPPGTAAAPAAAPAGGEPAPAPPPPAQPPPPPAPGSPLDPLLKGLGLTQNP
jgi:peptidoglycan hydrolase-like protein with peptidoglycan-binding domain